MILVDRSIPRAVARALSLVREDIIWLEDHFRHDCPDSEWLTQAGTNNWLVISRDKKIRSRPWERSAIMESGVGCFILSQKQPMTRWQYLRTTVCALGDMERLFSETKRPFIYTIDSSGRLQRVL